AWPTSSARSEKLRATRPRATSGQPRFSTWIARATTIPSRRPDDEPTSVGARRRESLRAHPELRGAERRADLAVAQRASRLARSAPRGPRGDRADGAAHGVGGDAA